MRENGGINGPVHVHTNTRVNANSFRVNRTRRRERRQVYDYFSSVFPLLFSLFYQNDFMFELRRVPSFDATTKFIV